MTATVAAPHTAVAPGRSAGGAAGHSVAVATGYSAGGAVGHSAAVAPDHSAAGAGGQSTAELAVLLPALLILVLVVVQVGVVARDYVVINHAAREAARRAAVAPSRSEALAAARQASPALEPERLTVALSDRRSTGDLLTVEVGYRSPTAVPIVGALIDDVEMSAGAVVRIE